MTNERSGIGILFMGKNQMITQWLMKKHGDLFSHIKNCLIRKNFNVLSFEHESYIFRDPEFWIGFIFYITAVCRVSSKVKLIEGLGFAQRIS